IVVADGIERHLGAPALAERLPRLGEREDLLLREEIEAARLVDRDARRAQHREDAVALEDSRHELGARAGEEERDAYEERDARADERPSQAQGVRNEALVPVRDPFEPLRSVILRRRYREDEERREEDDRVDDRAEQRARHRDR